MGYISTTFIAPDGTLLPAFDPRFFNVNGGLVIDTNAACGTSGGSDVDMVGVSGAFAAAQFVEGVVGRLGGVSYTGLAFRCGAAGSGNGYFWLGTPGNSFLEVMVAGVYSVIATPAPFAAGDLIAVHAPDNNFELFINGVSVGVYSDGTYPTGTVGLSGFRTDLLSGMASFRAGDLNPSGGFFVPAFIGGL